MSGLSPKTSAAFTARLLAALVLAGGIIATIIASRSVQARHDREIRQVFAAESETMRQSVSRQLQLFFDVLASMGALRELSDQISAEDFEEFAAKGMQFQQRLLKSYGFVQRVPHALRLEMEANADFFQFLDPDASGAFVPAAVRPEYFPIVSQQPEGALAFPSGLDMAALPGALDAIISMDQRRGPAIARALRIEDPQGGAGHFVFSPIFDRRINEDGFLSGFTVSILWPQEILARALADVATRDVLVRFYETDARLATSDDARSTLRVFSPITVADREWVFETIPSTEYLDARATMLPRAVLLAGVLITLLLTATIGLIAGRTGRIEAVVRERTRELEASMQECLRLESEILEIGEREKQKVGHDLHDSLGQKLTGAVYLSRALAKHLPEHDEEARTQAGRINEILKDTVAQVRRMARGLSPVELGQEGLAGALHHLASETSSVYGIHCIFHQADHAPTPPPKAVNHLYAIALEAVNNAVRHGNATDIVIELARTGDRGQLVIEDNGCGFDPASTRSGGMGLRIMEHRAAVIGGRVDIRRQPNGGMEVSCSF